MVDHIHCVHLIDIVRHDDGTTYARFPYADAIMKPNGRLAYNHQLESTPELVARLAHNISSALEYIHTKHIVHRDVKPDNILYQEDNGMFLLSDFGSAVLLASDDDDYVSESPATVAFYPPEVCVVDASRTHSGFSADVWALGMTVYCFMHKKLPYDVQTDSYIDLVDEIAKFVDPSPLYESMSDDANLKSILATLLMERQYWKPDSYDAH